MYTKSMPTRQTTSLPNVQQFTVANGNWDANRGPIMSIVLHTMVGTVEGTNARFNNSSSQVSSHYGVGLDGKLYQWVDEDNVAYAAGSYHINQTSINIECEDGGNYNDPRPDALYESCAKLVADICKFYDIPCDVEHIFRHADVIDKTVYPGGTSCPDALQTDRIISMAYQLLHPAPPAPVVEPVTPLVSPTVQQPVIVEPVPSQPTIPPAPTVEPTQTESNPVTNTVQNIPDQTPTPSTEANPIPSIDAPIAPSRLNVSLWSPQQAIREAVIVLVRLLVWLGLIEGVKK